MFSNDIKKRFIKDYDLPIQLLKDDYFEYFTSLYNDLFDVQSKIVLLTKAISECGDEEKFLHSYYSIRDDILKDIKAVPAYEEYNQADMNKYAIPKHDFFLTDVFKSHNNNKSFVSVDLAKANYQVMKLFNKEIVLGTNHYSELLLKYISGSLYDYVVGSKYLRQVIFGNLNPKRQVTMQKYYTHKILKLLVDSNIIIPKQVSFFTYDEIVFEGLCTVSECSDLTTYIKDKLSLEVNTESYLLKHYMPDNYYIKENTNGNIEFKGVPIVYFAQVFKNYYVLPIQDYDKRFLYENKIAQFVE